MRNGSKAKRANCSYTPRRLLNSQPLMHSVAGLERLIAVLFDIEEASALLKARVLCIEAGHRRCPRVELFLLSTCVLGK